jgi:hypothetical protein
MSSTSNGTDRGVNHTGKPPNKQGEASARWGDLPDEPGEPPTCWGNRPDERGKTCISSVQGRALAPLISAGPCNELSYSRAFLQ